MVYAASIANCIRHRPRLDISGSKRRDRHHRQGLGIAFGPLVVYDVANYEGAGLPALRIEFQYLTDPGGENSLWPLKLTQLVDPATSTVAGSFYSGYSIGMASGHFRYNGSTFRYDAYQASSGPFEIFLSEEDLGASELGPSDHRRTDVAD